MKKVLCITGDVLLYFLIALGIAFVAKNTVGLDGAIWEFAIALTIGWAIWQTIKYLIKRVKDRKSENAPS